MVTLNILRGNVTATNSAPLELRTEYECTAHSRDAISRRRRWGTQRQWVDFLTGPFGRTVASNSGELSPLADGSVSIRRLTEESGGAAAPPPLLIVAEAAKLVAQRNTVPLPLIVVQVMLNGPVEGRVMRLMEPSICTAASKLFRSSSLAAPDSSLCSLSMLDLLLDFSSGPSAPTP
ncbi:hypothetical protein Q1695_009292 [Nippostrongylus brasiliensis]|nr:hypothetical protein Q1695_009292 [Nippostrongylus brasiliensis]